MHILDIKDGSSQERNYDSQKWNCEQDAYFASVLVVSSNFHRYIYCFVSCLSKPTRYMIDQIHIPLSTVSV